MLQVGKGLLGGDAVPCTSFRKKPGSVEAGTEMGTDLHATILHFGQHRSMISP